MKSPAATTSSKLRLRSIFVLCASVLPTFAANFSYSTYLRSGFTPTAMTSDAKGNLYLAGRAVIDPASRMMSAVVMKLDPKASQYVYIQYLDSSATDTIGGIAVDAAGNAYVTGYTTNANFPTTGGAVLGTAPTSSTDPRSFVTKLSPTGVIQFSVLIGGSTASNANAIAVNPQGQIIVTGRTTASNFPVTAGAYTGGAKWFLVELDGAASKTIFSAAGIGGSSLALDRAGNIYVAGSAVGTDYPTTAGAYQTVFQQGRACFGLCQISFDGQLQHVTKVDPTGSRLIYSTGLNDTQGRAGSTVNTGLAVDAEGNAYVTGTLLEAAYPFTVAADGAQTYVTKLNLSGTDIVFSVPAGGAAVALDDAGALYAGGSLSSVRNTTSEQLINAPLQVPPALQSIPPACLPNNSTGSSGSYLQKIDPATGNVQDTQWIDGAVTNAVAVTVANGVPWIAGATSFADTPITPRALTTGGLGVGPNPGAYLAAVDFATSTGPSIACVLDAGNFTHVGPVAGYQVISIFGWNLGPVSGEGARDGATDPVGGVTATFETARARVLYASANQINLMIPLPTASPAVTTYPASLTMYISYNGAGTYRQFPFITYNLNLFANPVIPSSAGGFVPVVLNSDGSRNSPSNAAKLGSLVSFFASGGGGLRIGLAQPPFIGGLSARTYFCGAAIENAQLIGLIYRVDVRVPSTASCGLLSGPAIDMGLTFEYNGNAVGPLSLNPFAVTSRQLSLWTVQ